jgi:hypothetical protein
LTARREADEAASVLETLAADGRLPAGKRGLLAAVRQR